MNMTITDNSIRVKVNGDDNKAFTFNPHDTSFVARYMGMLKAIDEKEQECDRRMAELTAVTGTDGYGLPLYAYEEAKMTEDVCHFMRAQIDAVFGDGTSDTVFGDMNAVYAFREFFTEISRLTQGVRSNKLEKYAAPVDDGVLK